MENDNSFLIDIELDNLNKLTQENNITIIDVRTKEEFDEYHIKSDILKLL